MCQTQGDTIINLAAEPVHLHCSRHNFNVSIHDGICLHSSMSVATNYLCFVPCVFINTFFNVSINNIVVANVMQMGVDSGSI